MAADSTGNDSNGPGSKAELRRRLLDARAARDAAARAADDRRLAARLASWLRETLPGGPVTIAAHVPAAPEPGATSLGPDELLALVGREARLLLPVCPPGPPAALLWAEYAPGCLVTGKYGLSEPAGPRLPAEAIADADVVIVPGVAADRTGMRMGRGAGYYDRSLAHATGTVAAILHPGEIVDAVPHDAHDLPVDAVITADELIVPGA